MPRPARPFSNGFRCRDAGHLVSCPTVAKRQQDFTSRHALTMRHTMGRNRARRATYKDNALPLMDRQDTFRTDTEVSA